MLDLWALSWRCLQSWYRCLYHLWPTRTSSSGLSYGTVIAPGSSSTGTTSSTHNSLIVVERPSRPRSRIEKWWSEEGLESKRYDGRCGRIDLTKVGQTTSTNSSMQEGSNIGSTDSNTSYIGTAVAGKDVRSQSY